MATRNEFYQSLNTLQARFDDMEPELEVTLRDPELDLEGHVVVWNTAISRHGPLHNCGKGGTRIRAGLSQSEVRMLARNMAIKNAAAGLPLGGCKSGINADPNAPDFEKKYRRFVKLCQPFTHEKGGTFGGFGFDVGARPEHAIWACEELDSTRSFTGKPLTLGGTDYDKEGIAGFGVAIAAREIIELRRDDICAITFTLHGLGAMGAAVLRHFEEMGASLRAFGDPKYGGTWRFSQDISRPLRRALEAQEHATVLARLHLEAENISEDPNAVLYVQTDVLFPCAMQHVITNANCAQLNTRYIIEGANNPSTTETYNILFQKGVVHVPDFIANVGGVIAAYIELTSTVPDEDNLLTKAKVHEARSFTRKTIQRNVRNIAAFAKEIDIPLRDAGLWFALEAIFAHEDDQ